MRRYYIASGILLILPIIDFSIAAPALIKEKHQATVDVVRKPEDAITMVERRGDNVNALKEMFSTLLSENEDVFSSSTSHPSSSSLPPFTVDGHPFLNQPVPSTPEVLSPASIPDSGHAPPNTGTSTESEMDLNSPPGRAPALSTTMNSADNNLIGPPAESDAEKKVDPGPSAPPTTMPRRLYRRMAKWSGFGNQDDGPAPNGTTDGGTDVTIESMEALMEA